MAIPVDNETGAPQQAIRYHDRRLTIEAVVSLTEGTIRAWLYPYSLH